MYQITAQQISNAGAQILSVINSIVPSVLGIQITLVLLPVHTGDKRFNQ